MSNGIFLVFEGIDGSGKTTQIRQLIPWLDIELAKRNMKGCVVTKEPGAGEFGAAVRELLLHQKVDIVPMAETMLFMADRAQHMETLILPKLREGYTVICDRHTGSSVAYQAGGNRLEKSMIRILNTWTTLHITPNKNYLLDLPVHLSAKRVLESRGIATLDKMEARGKEFYGRVAEAYHWEATQLDPATWLVIDATLREVAIQDIVREDVLKLLNAQCTGHDHD